MTKNVGILNPFEVTESTTLAVQSTVDKNKYFTILVFRQHYTNLDTCVQIGVMLTANSRLRSIVSICEEQFGFVKGKSTTDVIFVLRQLQERYREGQQYLHQSSLLALCICIDLGKTTPEFLWKNCIGACETRSIRALYQTGEEHVPSMRKCRLVRCAARTSEPFAVGVGLHQGSAFSPFLFSIMMDSLTDKMHIGR